MRRLLLTAGSVLSIFLASSTIAVAQASPAATAAPFADYPTLTITIQDDGYVVDGPVPAGPTHLRVINATTKLPQAHIQIVRVPEDTDVVAIQQEFAAPNAARPDWFDRNLVGGPDRATPDHAADGVVVLAGGVYLVTDPSSGMSTPFNVAAESSSAAVPSEADVAEIVTLTEYRFAGLPTTVTAGEQVWKVINTGALPHELAIASIPPGMTTDQVLEAFHLDDDAPIPADLQPFADVAKPADFLPSAGSQEAGPGATTWIALNFVAGTTYVAFCFVPDATTNVRHAMDGMIVIFTAV